MEFLVKNVLTMNGNESLEAGYVEIVGGLLLRTPILPRTGLVAPKLLALFTEPLTCSMASATGRM